MAWEHGKSRQARGYGRQWERQREAILARDMGLCQPCQRAERVTPAREVDHIVPKAEGGTDDPDNLQAICIPCHQAKTAEEAARAQGRTPKKRIAFDAQGRPVW